MNHELKHDKVKLLTDILLFGGFDNQNTFYSFTPSNEQWAKLPDLPSNRWSHESIVVGRSIFIVGGCWNNTIEEYNISAKSFKKVATMETSRTDFGICVVNENEVLVSGGCSSGYTNATNNCFLFNTASKTFKDIADMNTKRLGHVLVNLEGIMYSIGGRDKDYELLNTIETFDPVTEQWKISDVELNIARSGHQAVAHKHLIYIFGGWYGPGYTDKIEKYNLLTGQIELLDIKLCVARSCFAVRKVDSDVYILGGVTSNGRTASCEIFNLETEEIREIENLPFSDWGFTACVV